MCCIDVAGGMVSFTEDFHRLASQPHDATMSSQAAKTDMAHSEVLA